MSVMLQHGLGELGGGRLLRQVDRVLHEAEPRPREQPLDPLVGSPRRDSVANAVDTLTGNVHHGGWCVGPGGQRLPLHARNRRRRSAPGRARRRSSRSWGAKNAGKRVAESGRARATSAAGRQLAHTQQAHCCCRGGGVEGCCCGGACVPGIGRHLPGRVSFRHPLG